MFIDGTHINASVNLNKGIKQEVPAAAKRYRNELLAEINTDREAHGKKPFDDEDDPARPAKKKPVRRKKADFKTVANSAYKTPHICKKVFEDGRVLPTA